MNVWTFYLTTSLIADFINSLYRIYCKHYRAKFYVGILCINKVIIIIIIIWVVFCCCNSVVCDNVK